jgi:hypothetical protein
MACITERMTLSDNEMNNSRKDILLRTKPKTNNIKDVLFYYGMNIWNNIHLNIHNVDNLPYEKNNNKA